jgi:hypothetical protein
LRNGCIIWPHVPKEQDKDAMITGCKQTFLYYNIIVLRHFRERKGRDLYNVRTLFLLKVIVLALPTLHPVRRLRRVWSSPHSTIYTSNCVQLSMLRHENVSGQMYFLHPGYSAHVWGRSYGSTV